MAYPSRRYTSSGFTLIELMIDVVIASFLSSIAIQAYGHYLLTHKITESFPVFGDYRMKMAPIGQDKRDYAASVNANTCRVTLSADNKYFDPGCTDATSGAQSPPASWSNAGVAKGNSASYSSNIHQAVVKTRRHSPSYPDRVVSGNTSVMTACTKQTGGELSGRTDVRFTQQPRLCYQARYGTPS